MTCKKYTLLLMLTISLFLVACNKKDEQKKQVMPPTKVGVASVLELPVGDEMSFVGRVEAQDTVVLVSRVEGVLMKRNFIEGDVVEEGALLFEIDRAPYLAALDRAKGDFAKAKAEQWRAEKEFKRNRQLIRGKVISQSDFDTAETTLAQAKAQVAVAAAAVDTAEINLGYTRITAPMRGRISRSIHSVGNVVSYSSGELATLHSIDPMYAYFSVNEQEVVESLHGAALVNSNSKKDKKATRNNFEFVLRFSNGIEYKELGKLNFTSTIVDPTTGTMTLRAEFANPDRTLLPGLYATVIARSVNKPMKIVIPQSAVMQSSSGYSVMIAKNTDDGKDVAILRNVKLGRRFDGLWVVESGLKSDDTIIVTGFQKTINESPIIPIPKKIDETNGLIFDVDMQQTQSTQGQ